MRRPSLLPVGSSQTERIREVIRHQFPALEPTRISAVNAFGVNSQNWKISCRRGAFVLKRVDASKAVALELQAAWVQRLSAGGFPAARFCPNKKKKLVFLFGGHAWCLTHFKKGSYLGASSRRWANLLGHERRLAAYCIRNSPKKFSSRVGSRNFFEISDTRVIRKLRNFPSGTGLHKAEIAYVLKKFTHLRRIYEKNEKNLHRAVFHVDIHPLNVLFQNNRLSLLADFDSFRTTTLELSLGFSVFKCARELLVGKKGPAFGNHLLRLKKILRARKMGYSFEELLVYGQMDVLKRLLYVVGEMLDRKRSRWRFMLATQLDGLREMDAMLDLLGSGKRVP